MKNLWLPVILVFCITSLSEQLARFCAGLRMQFLIPGKFPDFYKAYPTYPATVSMAVMLTNTLLLSYKHIFSANPFWTLCYADAVIACTIKGLRKWYSFNKQ